jgi:hypothetical protein
MSTLSLQRSKKLLQDQGFKVAIVEHWNMYAHVRQDLYGLADLVAVRGDRSGTTYVQCCGEDVHSHIEKMVMNTVLPEILKAGNPVFLWAWRKRGERGKRKLWHMKEYELVLKDGLPIAQETKHEEETNDVEGTEGNTGDDSEGAD